MLYGKILFISVRGLLQATVIMLIATLLGVRIWNPVNIILIYLSHAFSIFGVFLCSIKHDQAVLK